MLYETLKLAKGSTDGRWARNRRSPDEARTLANGSRPLLQAALQDDEARVEEGLAAEERTERNIDRACWMLKSELERMRHS